MNEITMPGWTVLSEGQSLEGIIDSDAPHVGIYPCGRFVILNVIQTRSREEDIRFFCEGLKIGIVQRGPIILGMINGGIGGDNLVLPCNCGDCDQPYAKGYHDVWSLVLAHHGVVSALRVATTTARFSKIFRKSVQQVAPHSPLVAGSMLTEEACEQLVSLRSLSHRQLWRMADGTSRFGG